jgi:hypothetical protein
VRRSTAAVDLMFSTEGRRMRWEHGGRAAPRGKVGAPPWVRTATAAFFPGVRQQWSMRRWRGSVERLALTKCSSLERTGLLDLRELTDEIYCSR